MASERQSSRKHGLTSSTLVVLPEEDRQEYDELLRGFRESLQPEGGLEDALVPRLAQAHWRSLRSRSLETAILYTSAKMQRRQARRIVENCPEHLDLHEAIGVGFMAMPAEHWQMYLRYDTTISRDFFRTLDSLTRQQRLRRPAGGAELSDSGIRSVSQNDATSAGHGICSPVERVDLRFRAATARKRCLTHFDTLPHDRLLRYRAATARECNRRDKPACSRG